MTILLLRHGKTEANEQHLYCGNTDLPLSEAGREELLRFSYTAPENCRYITSGLGRANETLQILFGNVTYETEADLREMDFGKFEMHSYGQLKSDPDYIAWICGDNESNTPPGGESGNAMKKRALAAFQKIAAEGQHTVILTHGGVIAAVMAQLFPKENKNRYQWQSANGCGYKLSYEQGVWTYEILPKPSE